MFSPPHESGPLPGSEAKRDADRPKRNVDASFLAGFFVGHVDHVKDAVIRIDAGRRQKTVAAARERLNAGAFSWSCAHSRTVGLGPRFAVLPMAAKLNAVAAPTMRAQAMTGDRRVGRIAS